MTFTQWLLANVGRPIDIDGVDGDQCMDAINSYLMNVMRDVRATGNAKDLPPQVFRGMAWAENKPTNAPRPGSIVVWRPGKHGQVTISAFGHTAVSVIADRWGFISADQNWEDIPTLRLCLHNYDGVWGWHHPL